jgi:2-methylcitrate dehydratase PrpD
MVKGAHPGKAAANGLLATLLAERGLAGPPGGLEAPGGLLSALGDPSGVPRLLAGLGERWELLANTFKPYPSGVVTHPVIDAALQLAPRLEQGAEIEAIEIRCHPLVRELTERSQPQDGLEARFSAPHAVAVALLDGQAGLAQFSDERVRDAPVGSLRERVALTVDERVALDEASVLVRLADGRVLERHIAHARGSLARPLREAELHAKAQSLIEAVLPGRTARIVDAVDGLWRAPDLRVLVEALTPWDGGGS